MVFLFFKKQHVVYACVCVLLVDKLLGRRFSNSGCRVLIPVLGCQVVQAGGDVLAVVVHLFTVEGALAVKTAEGLSQFHQLCLSTLPVLLSHLSTDCSVGWGGEGWT